MEAERFFTLDDLKRYHGDGITALVAFDGIVYDVSSSRRWRSGLHELSHWAGQDLTAELKDAPHGREVFSHPGIQRVGILISS